MGILLGAATAAVETASRVQPPRPSARPSHQPRDIRIVLTRSSNAVEIRKKYSSLGKRRTKK
jgi:hypothetical protein